MDSKAGFISQARGIWLERRWLILAVVALLSVLLELPEITTEPYFFRDPLHNIELIIHGIILPGMLITLQRTENQKNEAINTLSLLESFVYQLNRAQSWDELIEIIVQFPRNILPLAGTCLWIYAPASKSFDVELSRIFETTVQTNLHQNSLALKDMNCCQAETDKISGMRLCNCPLQNMFPTMHHHRYCLPLADSNAIVGLLHLYLPLSYKLLKEQKNLLNNAVPEIILSIDKAILQRKTILQEGTIETERLRLASDLHDTLGQDVAYLRNKLDQLIEGSTFRRNPLIREELHQMRLVAEGANQTVRNILAVTHSNQGAKLEDRLLAYARAISERANLAISLESIGQSQTLSTHMQFQIFLMFREILANIEKHANAQEVHITLTWTNEELELAISDDGGGFTMDHLDKNDHFGLTIIETRAKEMNGSMSVISAPNQGTQVSIRLPAHLDEQLPSRESMP